MKCLISILFVLFAILSSHLAHAQSCDDYQREAYILVEDGSIQIPNGDHPYMLSDISIDNAAITTVFNEHNIQSIRRLLPNAQPDKLLRVARTGEIVKLHDYSDWYVVSATTMADLENFLESTKSIDAILFASRGIPPKTVIPIHNPVFESISSEIETLEQSVQSIVIDIDDPCYWWQKNLHHPTKGINVEEAWEYSTGSPSVLIGLIDTGVPTGVGYPQHSELLDRVQGDSYVIQEDNQCSGYNHGIGAAGIIAAKGNNGSMIAGINWNSIIHTEVHKKDELHPVYGVQCINYIFEAYSRCTDAGCHIVLANVYGSQGAVIEGMLVSDLYMLNTLVIGPSGNYPVSTPSFPAAFPMAMCVGATGEDGKYSGFSSYGPHLDVSAPGFDSWSLGLPDNFVIGYNGTSCASPHVAGLASLLLSVDNSLYNDDLKNIMEISATDVETPGWDEYTGFGRINAGKAMSLLHPPYSYDHIFSSGGGSVEELDYGLFEFLGSEGLAMGMYTATKFRVSKTVGYTHEYCETPYVWGRGVPTIGYSPDRSNYGIGYCDVTGVTETGFVISTYCYHVYNIGGADCGWHPCEPSQIQWHYTVLGIKDIYPPSVTVNDPNGGEYYHTTDAIHIEWDVDDEYLEGVSCGISKNIMSGDGPWTGIANNLTVDSNGHGEFDYQVPSGSERTENHWRIRVIANDSNQNQGLDMSDADFTVEFYSKPNDEPIPHHGFALTKCFLSEPYPNPFNPSTTFWYGSKNESYARLAVYDASGRLVRTLLKNTMLSPGFHSETWDGHNDSGVKVSSGVYFLKFIAGDYSKTQKLILLQ